MPGLTGFSVLTNNMRRNIELSRVVTMNRWTKVVGLLFAVVLVIVIAPDLDLLPRHGSAAPDKKSIWLCSMLSSSKYRPAGTKSVRSPAQIDLPASATLPLA
jgi:hypothetical protein